MKKIIATIAISFCLATTSFSTGMEDGENLHRPLILETARTLAPLSDIDLTVLTDIKESCIENPRTTDLCSRLLTNLNQLQTLHREVSTLLYTLQETTERASRTSPQTHIDFYAIEEAEDHGESLNLTRVTDSSLRTIIKNLEKVTHVDPTLFSSSQEQQDIQELYIELFTKITELKTTSDSILPDLNELDGILEENSH